MCIPVRAIPFKELQEKWENWSKQRPQNDFHDIRKTGYDFQAIKKKLFSRLIEKEDVDLSDIEKRITHPAPHSYTRVTNPFFNINNNNGLQGYGPPAPSSSTSVQQFPYPIQYPQEGYGPPAPSSSTSVQQFPYPTQYPQEGYGPPAPSSSTSVQQFPYPTQYPQEGYAPQNLYDNLLFQGPYPINTNFNQTSFQQFGPVYSSGSPQKTADRDQKAKQSKEPYARYFSDQKTHSDLDDQLRKIKAAGIPFSRELKDIPHDEKVELVRAWDTIQIVHETNEERTKNSNPISKKEIKHGFTENKLPELAAKKLENYMKESVSDWDQIKKNNKTMLPIPRKQIRTLNAHLHTDLLQYRYNWVDFKSKSIMSIPKQATPAIHLYQRLAFSNHDLSFAPDLKHIRLKELHLELKFGGDFFNTIRMPKKLDHLTLERGNNFVFPEKFLKKCGNIEKLTCLSFIINDLQQNASVEDLERLIKKCPSLTSIQTSKGLHAHLSEGTKQTLKQRQISIEKLGK